MRWMALFLLSLCFVAACGGKRPSSLNPASSQKQQKLSQNQDPQNPNEPETDYLTEVSLPEGLSAVDSSGNLIKNPDGEVSTPADDLTNYVPPPDPDGEPAGLVDSPPVGLSTRSSAFTALKGSEKYRKVSVNLFPNDTKYDLKLYPGPSSMDARKFRFESNGDLLYVSSDGTGVIASGRVVEIDLSKKMGLKVDGKEFEFKQPFYDIAYKSFDRNRPWINACWPGDKTKDKINWPSGNFCRRYRGSFSVIKKSYSKIQSYGSRDFINIVNIVYLDDYLKGVIPSEMPSGSPEQALIAFIDSARSYALSQAEIARKSNYGKLHDFDLEPTQANQVYKGFDFENPRVTELIRSTRGQVILHNQKIIKAKYHADSYGLTCSSKSEPYLKSVQDPTGPRPDVKHQGKSKVVIVKVKELLTVLKKMAIQLKETVIRAITPKRDSSGHIATVEIAGNQSAVLIPKEQVKLFHESLKVPDNYEQAYVKGDDIYFPSHAFGPCLGLDQNGAIILANNGMTAEQIIKNYYTDVQVGRIQEL